jgi:hypothetical protein
MRRKKSRKEAVEVEWSQEIWILFRKRKFGFYHLGKQR